MRVAPLPSACLAQLFFFFVFLAIPLLSQVHRYPLLLANPSGGCPFFWNLHMWRWHPSLSDAPSPLPLIGCTPSLPVSGMCCFFVTLVHRSFFSFSFSTDHSLSLTSALGPPLAGGSPFFLHLRTLRSSAHNVMPQPVGFIFFCFSR